MSAITDFTGLEKWCRSAAFNPAGDSLRALRCTGLPSAGMHNEVTLRQSQHLSISMEVLAENPQRFTEWVTQFLQVRTHARQAQYYAGDTSLFETSTGTQDIRRACAHHLSEPKQSSSAQLKHAGGAGAHLGTTTCPSFSAPSTTPHLQRTQL